MFSRKLLGVLVLVALVMCFSLFTGCSPEQEAGGETIYKMGDTRGDWGFPAPYLHYQRGPGYVRLSYIFDTLVWKDDTGFIPALARDWEYLEVENAYIFDLQKDVSWHDGEPFSADDVAFTFKYIKEHPYLFVDVTIVDKADVLDDYRVKLTLKEPYSPFLSNIAASLPILPKHIYKDVDDPENFTEPKAAIGTGPYKYEDYKQEMGTYLYTANEDYYLGKPAFDKIMFVKINENMAASALEKREVDAIVIKPEMKDALAESGFNCIKGTHDMTVKMMINHRKEPFSRKELRQALAYGIDRERLVEVVNRGFALGGSMGVLPADSPWFNDEVEKYEHDPEKARQLIESLGYIEKDGFYEKDGQVLSCELLVVEQYNRDAEFIKNELEKIGIKVVLKGIEIKTLDVKVNEWNFDLALNDHGGLGGDPIMLERITTGDLVVSIKYTQNDVLTKILNRQIAEMDIEKRKDLLHRAQNIIAQDVPVLMLYYPDTYFAFNEKASLYFTPGGLGTGVPHPYNKMIFVNEE